MNKRILIYNASIKIISKNGFSNTKVQDIVNAANISIGSFYNYFNNKNDLLYYIFESRIKSLINELTEISFMNINPLKKIELYFDLLTVEPSELKTVIKEECWCLYRTLSPEKKKSYLKLSKELSSKFENIVRNGQALNLIKDISPSIIYNLLNSITNESFNSSILPNNNIVENDNKLFFISIIT